ncbi:riboflavin biosynthesis protein RibF [Bacillus sp. JJ1533]|uniref:riboflavin biosynthesis protein RibF n=1 Tax=Bacillus sp. JJ1533 TaxID=3122959 RepID=UPI002FFFE7C6
MEVIQFSTKQAYDSSPLILAIGEFDGVHLGHKAIIQAAKGYKKDTDYLAVLCFSDSRKGLQERITPEKEKIALLNLFGVQRYYTDVSIDHSDITIREFILKYISKLNVKRFIVDEDFQFRNKKESVFELVKVCAEINIPITVVPTVKINGKRINSESIYSLIEAGKMEAVQSQLSRPYSITGKVVHGEALGRTLGFPTINLGEMESYVFPKSGVYLGTAEIQNESDANEIWNVLISAGYRPTVDGKGYLIEAYLIDYSGDLYGKTVSVSFLRYMREEIKFNGLDPLIKQMELDKMEARSIMGL